MGLESFPSDTASPDYNEAVLKRINDGDFDVSWSPIQSRSGDNTATFYVMSDALKIDGVRISVSAYLQQTIADMLGAMLLTPKIADLAWLQRDVTLKPTPRPITSKLEGMIANSQAIDAQIPATASGILQTVGKHWVLSNELLNHGGRAINYGWHFDNSFGGQRWAPCFSDPQNPHCRVIQDPGWAHDPRHIDYSQTCVLVKRECLVNGHKRDLVDILKDPALAPLASHEGVLRVFRQPGVPVTACLLPINATADGDQGCPSPIREPQEGKISLWPVVVVSGVVGGVWYWLYKNRHK